MKWLLLALVVAAFSACARDSIVLIIGSHHVESNGWCEFNPGIGLARQGSAFKWGFGIAKNSFCNPSAYGAIDKVLWRAGALKGGIRAGLATGYPGSPLSPFAGFTATVPLPGFDFTVTAVPKNKPVFVFNIEWPI